MKQKSPPSKHHWANAAIMEFRDESRNVRYIEFRHRSDGMLYWLIFSTSTAKTKYLNTWVSFLYRDPVYGVIPDFEEEVERCIKVLGRMDGWTDFRKVEKLPKLVEWPNLLRANKKGLDTVPTLVDALT